MEALLAKVKKMSLSDVQNLANEVLPLVSVSMTNSQITDLLMKMLPMLSGLEIKSSGHLPGACQRLLVGRYGGHLRRRSNPQCHAVR